MDTKQELLKAFVDSPDQETRDRVLLRLYRLFRLEKKISTADVVTPHECHRHMRKWLSEQYYFEQFRRYYPLPNGTIEYTDRPDFILHGVRKIGIEITNFFKEDGGLPESEQRQREARDEVVSGAQRLYLENGGRGITLIVSFDEGSPIGERRQALAERIATLASQIDGRQTGQIGNDLFEAVPELSFVYLIAEDTEHSQWRAQQRYEGSLLSRDKLLAVVETKERKARCYQRCDAYWLVVVVDFMDPAQDQEIRLDGFQKIDSIVFERVLVYKTVFHHILTVTGPE